MATRTAPPPGALRISRAKRDGDSDGGDGDAAPDITIGPDVSVEDALDAPDEDVFATHDGGLLPNGGFDDPGTGCGGGWTRDNAALTHDSTAHAGSRNSCRICRVAPALDAFLSSCGSAVVGKRRERLAHPEVHVRDALDAHARASRVRGVRLALATSAPETNHQQH